MGKDVLKAAEAVNTVLAGAWIEKCVVNQRSSIELIKLNGTPNKSKLSVNTILGVSMALVKAAAQAKGISLYRHLADLGGLWQKWTVTLALWCSPCLLHVKTGGSLAGN